jgi:hypothetical protein
MSTTGGIGTWVRDDMNPDEEALAIVHPRKAHGTIGADPRLDALAAAYAALEERTIVGKREQNRAIDAEAEAERLRAAGDALASHLRLRTAAPSGTHICTCRRTGINPPRCWYCDARDLYLAWTEATT